MSFPINFVAGAAIGAATTYIIKDEVAKNWLSNTSKKVKDQADSMVSSIKKKPADEKPAPKAAS